MSEAHDGAADLAATEDTTAADLVAEDAAEAQEVDADLGDDATAETDGEGERPKPRRSVQERIDEAIRKQRDAEREAEFWRSKATQTDQPKREEAPKPVEDAEPDPADYEYGETDARFIKDSGRWAARQEFQRLTQEAARQNQVRTVEQSWDDRQQSFAKATPDYFQVLERNWECSAPMADAIKTSDHGPAVAYHLAQNPEEARRIAGLNPLAAIREIGRLEARFDVKSSAPPPKQASDVPPPPQTLRGQGGRFKPPPDTDDFAAFEKNYG